jgi:D-lactate dehydrogenase
VKVAIFSAHNFETCVLNEVNQKFNHDLHYFELKLDEKTATLAKGFECVSIFANDSGSEEVLRILKDGGTKLLALRSAGFNHVNLQIAKELGIKVVRVPAYSPFSVAEHATGLILCLNRKIHKAYNRVREGNFSLEGLVGFDLHGKTVGVVGTGKIGQVFSKIMKGFGCEVIAFDLNPDGDFSRNSGVEYTSFSNLLNQSDIISIHVPLNPHTFHLFNENNIKLMKKGSLLINTGRGAIIDTKALIEALKVNHLAGAGLDVYEEEEGLFFSDHSSEVIKDDDLARLMTFPNVLITGHQGFLTKEALTNISQTTLQNIDEFERKLTLTNQVL